MDCFSCRKVADFEKIARIGAGTYGTVYRARDKRSGEIVALKKLRMKDGVGRYMYSIALQFFLSLIATFQFPLTSIREIKLLNSLDHPNIIRLLDTAVGTKPSGIFLVFEYCQRDFADLLDNVKRPFTESEVKCILLQLLRAVDYLHSNFIIHRDLKLSNLLMNKHGQLKLADFGLARHYEHPLRPYTPKVVTLWYRAPELLLGEVMYHTAIDIWAVGCIFAELLQNRPLFPGKSEIDQLELTCRMLGAPSERIWPGFSKLPNAQLIDSTDPEYTYNNLTTEFPDISELGLDLLNNLLTYDPSKRLTARKALEHPYFSENPLPTPCEMMPTFPAASSSDGPASKRKKMATKSSQDERFGEAFGSYKPVTKKLKRAQ